MKKFVICINDAGYDDIQKMKIYEVIAPNQSTDKNMLRIIDDSGEDYLYPYSCFESIDVPVKVQELLAA